MQLCYCLATLPLLAAGAAVEGVDDADKPGRLKVAVIGGGLAGSATALELLRHDHVDVTLFEQADKIGHTRSASGIIAALTIFNAPEQYWRTPKSLGEFDTTIENMAQSLRIGGIPTYWENFRMLQFMNRAGLYKARKDIRGTKDYKRKFLNASRLRLEEHLDRFPELCLAVQGPYCVREGSKARLWMDKHENETCAIRRGVAHAWLSGNGLVEDGFQQADKPELAKKGGWQLGASHNDPYGIYAESTKWLREDDLAGVLFNSADEGFIRVESLYPILTKIFRSSGRVKLALNCLVDSLKASDRGIAVSASACPASGVYDRVIVAGGANTVNIVEDQDEVIMSQLFPIKGFAVVTNHTLMDKDQLGIGMNVEGISHYIRPTITGGVAYGFGKEVGMWDDQLLDPTFEHWEQDGPAATGLGREVLKQTDVQKLSGIRPISALGDFPLLKRYGGKWSGLVLNTGYGFYGYTLSWKSAQIATEIAISGEVSDPLWAEAVELYDACGFVPCWLFDLGLVFGFLTMSLWAWFLCVCGCGCGCCLSARACLGCWVCWRQRRKKNVLGQNVSAGASDVTPIDSTDAS